jgi:hypothetical protein
VIPFWSRFLRVVVGVLAVTIGSVAVSAWALDEHAGEPSGAPAAAAPLQERAAREVDDFLERARALRRADAPDPFVAVDGQPYLFTTNTAAGNVPVVTPAPGGGGPAVADALPVLPAWAAPGFTWAPAVTQAGDQWVLAFMARHAASGRQCIGVATPPAVAGRYTPADAPLVCDLDRGGSIDPSFVADGGGLWLLYKDDGNCCGWPTTLHSVPLTPDGTALAGEPSDLMAADRPWEGDLVEAPSMKRVGDRWLLLYSANRWDSPDYAVGAAWCASPAGPCEKQDDPVLAAGGGLDGPGGVEFVSGGGADRDLVTFHAWPAGAVGYGDGSTRRLQVGHVEVDGDEASITPVAPRGR